MDRLASVRFKRDQSNRNPPNQEPRGRASRRISTGVEKEVRKARYAWCHFLMTPFVTFFLASTAYLARQEPSGLAIKLPSTTISITCHLVQIACLLDIYTTSPYISSLCDVPECAAVQNPATALDARIKALEESVPRMANPVPLRNFALKSNGASVIPELTSATLGLKKPSFFQRVRIRLRGYDVDNASIQLPSVVIEGGTLEGRTCWQIPGSKGHIGILLDGLVFISGITIYHPQPQLISSYETLKAPKTFYLWGLASNNTFASVSSADGGANIIDICPPQDFTIGASPPHLILPTDIFVKLAEFNYNATIGGFQTFEVPGEAHHGWIGFNVAVVEIRDNYGGEATCLHHTAIHGTEI